MGKKITNFASKTSTGTNNLTIGDISYSSIAIVPSIGDIA